ncbi:TonB-linked SusC/RagA family outer membrane protein [Mucilaginibacter frigoritolerans]|uniref:TonB-linked SusC/RagA family outer membrane protein n=1 Tax=Mucilaginibacter frigoritolerans TaxID=652788 RepID=A0A562UCM9_9SPHI|nr:SusC/RagA family TonB-linked outer membrane protein [Mucilaginibacter frigoritolerans]TWJ03582.1 TonB-linked SusC/RagA family outer membrane protein [Mucilaginibacter frigoritolerans]
MKKLLLVSLCFLMLCITQAFAQNRTVTGTVTAKDDGLPMPGVSVKVKGTSIGTQTNAAGKYTLSVPKGSTTLVFTFIGYEPFEKPITGGDVKLNSQGNVLGEVNITMNTSSRQLGEVVVTGALGVKRQAKELGYAATQIESKSLTEAQATNFTNGLSGKAPGLVINTVDNGINPQTRFTLRGNRHITGNNFALVVLNGVPVSPNDVNNINPDDIESVNILNGAGAAALYGSEASNGALIITTKRGSGSGAPVINYQNTFQLEKISYFPDLQTRFGSYGGEGVPYEDARTGYITTPVPFENQSYGPAYNGALTQLGIPDEAGTKQYYPYSTPKVDPRLAFFNTGHTEQNSVSYAQGDANNSFNLSANRLDRTGVVPNDTYNRSVVRVSATKTTGIVHLDFTAAYTNSNTSTYGGGYQNGGALLSTLLNTPSWVPITNFKNINAPFADVNTYFNSYDINPYWYVDENRINTRSDVFNGSFGATVSPTKWFDATYRLADNFGTAQVQQTKAPVNFDAYALSDPTGGYGTIASETFGTGGTSGHIPGYVYNTTQFGDGSTNTGGGPQGYSRIQQDMVLNFHKTFFNDFKTNLLLGNTIWQEYYNNLQNSSTQLLVDNFYGIGSILGTPGVSQDIEEIRQIAYFGDLSIGYKDWAFIEGTLRNDHDSRLAATNRSFFYPSVKGSVILTDAIDALKNNKILSYAKVRGSYSQVGDVNSVPYGYVNTYAPTGGFPYGNTGGLSLSQQLNNPTLKPELTRETEVGVDLGFLNNRINASATYYDSHTKDQTLPITVSPATGYQQTLINIGEVQNTGEEFKLDIQVLTKAQNGVGLTLGGNFSIQNSKVISLYGGLQSITVGGYSNAAVQARVGKPFPELYGTDVNRDPQGHVIVDANTGMPSANPNLVDLGRLTPKNLLGLTQTVSWKFITLTAVSEFRSGYVVYQQGLSAATAAGTSGISAQAGRQVFVFPNSVINTGSSANPVYTPNTNTTVLDGNLGFWDSGAYYNSASTYVVNGAFWKLREADLSFDLTQWVRKSKFIKKASFAITGRNLVMLRAPGAKFTDPEFQYSSGNNGIGVSNTGQLPPTRIFGANLNVTF